jgi:hypothetical protein
VVRADEARRLRVQERSRCCRRPRHAERAIAIEAP